MITVSPRLRRQENELERLLAQGGRPDDPSLSRLLDLATSLRPGPLTPDPGFRAELRSQLVAEAAERVPAQTGRGGRTAAPAPAPRRHRLRAAVAGVTLAAVVAGTGSALAASRALPGDPLYGLKRDIEQAQLALAHGDVGKGKELLEQADARLSETERMATGEDAGTPETQQRISASLAALDADVRQATDLLTQAYRATGDPEPMRILSTFLADEGERLTDLLPLLPDGVAAQARAVLALLQQVQQGADAVVSGSALGATGVAGLVAAARAAPAGGTGPGATTGGSSGSSGGTSAGGTGGTTLGGVVGSVGTAVGGVVGSLTGSGGTSGGTGPGTTSSAPLPLPQASVSQLLPQPSSSPTPTPTPSSGSGGILPSLPLPSPSGSTCLPLIQHC